jgi:hypothetical protein
MVWRRRWVRVVTVTVAAGACGGGADEGEVATSDENARPVAEVAAAAPADTLVEIVAGDVLSASENQTVPAEDPTNGDLWFSVIRGSFDDQRIMVSRRADDSYSPPEPAPFSGEWGDRAPRFTPSGDALLFTSNRPRPGSSGTGDMNVWRSDRGADGSWSEPRLLETEVNSAQADIHPSVTTDAIWVASNRDGGLGRSDIYRVGADGIAQHFPAPLNSARSEPDLWVSPDETWMVLAITDHPDGFGGDDLYVSTLVDGAWTEPVNLGPGINTPEYEYGPWVTADGEHLLFTSHRDGASNVYRVPMTAVHEALAAAGEGH